MMPNNTLDIFIIIEVMSQECHGDPNRGETEYLFSNLFRLPTKKETKLQNTGNLLK